jgi:hypothetical protein
VFAPKGYSELDESPLQRRDWGRFGAGVAKQPTEPLDSCLCFALNVGFLVNYRVKVGTPLDIAPLKRVVVPLNLVQADYF